MYCLIRAADHMDCSISVRLRQRLRTARVRNARNLINRSKRRPGIHLADGRAAALQDGHHSILGAQGDARLQFYFLLRLETQSKALGEHGENQCRFRHGKRRADAHPRSAAEGQVREARPLLACFLVESLRVEQLWIVPKTAVTMQHPGRYHHLHPGVTLKPHTSSASFAWRIEMPGAGG